MDVLATGQAMGRLKHYKHRLRPQQYKTLRGQILKGDTDGALRGLQKLLKRKEYRMKDQLRQAILAFADLGIQERVEAINEVKALLKQVSPFTAEPVECVQWVPSDKVIANDYNPNSVAPPEMELLHISIQEDGYTQPIVVWQHDGIYEVVDGFHRNRVGKEYADIKERVHGYLPCVVINNEREDKGDRIASTIRHNRARGKHSVDGMSEIVIELKRRNWSDAKIAKELGMDADEVLRLTQITGLAEMFADKDFSRAWEVDMTDELLESYDNTDLASL